MSSNITQSVTFITFIVLEKSTTLKVFATTYYHPDGLLYTVYDTDTHFFFFVNRKASAAIFNPPVGSELSIPISLKGLAQSPNYP